MKSDDVLSETNGLQSGLPKTEHGENHMRDEITSMFNLSDRVTLITGGARDFGVEIAEVLGGAGSNLVITSRSLASAEKTAEILHEKLGVDVLPLQLEVTDATAVSDVAHRAREWKGQIDVLVNNAGGGSGKGSGHLFERSTEDADRLLAVNLNGCLYCCRAVGRIMANQGHGKIINIASIAGLIGRDRRMYDRHGMAGQPIDYAAAKAGVIGMTSDLAGLLTPMGVHVNAISPGGFNRNLPEGFVRDYADRTPLGRMGRDGIDLRGAVLFLATAASDYVTGHNLIVDGGFTTWQ